MLSTWLRCDICGDRTQDEGLCSGCGAQRGTRVPLSECEPDGVWILAARGGRDQVLKQLGRSVAIAPGPHGPSRLAVLRRLLTAFPGTGQIEVRLDLRGAEAGALHSQRRRGNSRETFHRLPWLWVLGLDLEASVTRTLHRKVVRTFRAGVESSATRFELDELRLRTSEGGIRRPFRRPSSLAKLGPQDLEPSVPGLDEPLCPSAPGVGGEAPRGTALALVAAALLLLLAPAFLSPEQAVPPLGIEVRFDSKGHPLAKVSAEQAARNARAPRTIRRALLAADPHQRRTALTHLGALPEAERWRALVVSARDPLPDVRERALEELSRTPLGTAALAERCQASAPFEARLQAFEFLRRSAPSRARQIALASLEASSAPDRLRRTWTLALGELCQPGDAPAAAVLARVLVEAGPAEAAAAARSLVALAPHTLGALLPPALERALLAGDERAVLTLALALREAKGDLQILILVADDPRLSTRAQRRLRNLAR